MLPHDAKTIHSTEPPCFCDDCLRASAAEDQRRAEIREILRNLDELGLHITTADKLEREAGKVELLQQLRAIVEAAQ
jgi:hypothetical protein